MPSMILLVVKSVFKTVLVGQNNEIDVTCVFVGLFDVVHNQCLLRVSHFMYQGNH